MRRPARPAARSPAQQGRIERLTILSDLAGLLNSTLDQREVRRRAMEAATRLMDTEVGSLLLIDEAAGELYFEVALGEKGARVKELRLKIGQGIAGWVAQTGQPAVVNDVAADSRFYRAADDRSHFVTRNMICVPVRSKDRMLGVLQAINKRRGRFTDQDLADFTSLAHQVAVAIENALLYAELQETFHATASTLAEAIEKRDLYTGGHTRRVLEYSLVVGRTLGFTPDRLDILRLTALLHDVGKIGVDDAVLRKPAKLTDEEYQAIKRHATIGWDIVRHAKRLAQAATGIRAHHEHYDGSGYPDGAKGDAIPIESRIIGVVDAFDSMTSDRPYRKGFAPELALGELKKHAGTQFDPRIVQAFLAAYEQGEIQPILATAKGLA